MNRSEFYDYIIKSFCLSEEAQRLVDNILRFVADNYYDENEQYRVLSDLLGGAIGLSDEEIRKALFGNELSLVVTKSEADTIRFCLNQALMDYNILNDETSLQNIKSVIKKILAKKRKKGMPVERNDCNIFL